MKIQALIITCLLLANTLIAQRTIPPTDSFRITGKIKQSITYALSKLDSLPQTILSNQIIYNHKGEIKDTLTNLKGINLKTILAPLELLYDKPKELNEFYFVFIGSDGYSVVFSWNEIYNTAIGNNCFIITNMEDKPIRDLPQRIVFISTGDLKAGRRYLKGLATIDVRRID